MGLEEPRSSVPKVSMAPGSYHQACWNWPGWPHLQTVGWGRVSACLLTESPALVTPGCHLFPLVCWERVLHQDHSPILRHKGMGNDEIKGECSCWASRLRGCWGHHPQTRRLCPH